MEHLNGLGQLRQVLLDAHLSTEGDGLASPDAEGVAPRLEPGDRLDDLRVEREIHRGRSSSIYEVSARSGRRLAAKVLAPELAIHVEPLRRFRREAELAQVVAHPAIVRVHGDGSDAERHWFLMRLERGETLADLADEGRARRQEEWFVDLAARFLPVVEGVAALHERGIVHRGLEPSNLLLDAEGLLLLTDFGCALSRDRTDADRTEVGERAAYYTSPEQLGPDADPRDPSADVYALGLIFSEALTGRRVFADLGEGAIARHKLTRRPPTPRQVNPYVPLGLEAIVRQATEDHVSMRYVDAGEMARDLARFVSRKRGHLRRHRLTP